MGSTSRLRGAALAATAAILLGACSSGTTPDASSSPSGDASQSAAPSTGEKVRIVWSTWGNPDELTRFEEFDQQFMAKHPEIEVVLQPVADYGEYHSKLLTQLTSGTAPDVFYLGDDNIGKFVAANVLLPLDDRMSAPGSLAPSANYADGIFGAARQGGATYGIPNDVNPDLFWYNKKALTAAGITDDPATLADQGKWTIDAFLGMIDKLKAAGLQGAMYWNYWATHYSWVSVNGGKTWDESGNLLMTKDPTSLAALKTLGERFADGKSFVVADDVPDPGSDALFVTGKVGFFCQGRYTIGSIKAAADPNDFDVVRWPSVTGQPMPSGVAASYLAINKASKNADAAWAFFQEFVGVEGQTFRLQGGGNAVPSVKGADSVVLDGYPAHAQAMLDARDIGFAAPVAEGIHPGLSGDISNALHELYIGKATFDATIAAIDSLVAKAK